MTEWAQLSMELEHARKRREDTEARETSDDGGEDEDDYVHVGTGEETGAWTAPTRGAEAPVTPARPPVLVETVMAPAGVLASFEGEYVVDEVDN